MTEQEFRDTQIIENDEGWWIEGQDEAVMYKYEQPGITAGVQALYDRHPFDSVIELGFGAGYTAQKFQDLGVQRHVIIEPHPYFYQRALSFAEGKPRVAVLNEFWQTVDIPGKVDLVYYDTYDLSDHGGNPHDKFKNAKILGLCWIDNTINVSWIHEIEYTYGDGKTARQPYIPIKRN